MKDYNPIPIDTSDVQLPRDLYTLMEELAKSNHDTWAMHRFEEGWSYGPNRDDISKKKQERQEKLQNTQRKRQYSSSPNKNRSMKNNENVINIKQRSSQKKENTNSKSNSKNNTIPINSKKLDELINRLQNKRDINNLKCLKDKKEQDELALCTFQPNMHKLYDSNSKEKIKNRAKLNKKQIDQNFEKLY